MKPSRLLTFLAAALLCVASPQPSHAADVVVDISSFAPREPSVIIRQIELNVAIRQYEKVLMELHEARLQYEIGPAETGLTGVQRKEWSQRAELKLKYLDETAEMLRLRIHGYVTQANEMAREFEKAKAKEKEKAEPKAETKQPNGQPLG